MKYLLPILLLTACAPLPKPDTTKVLRALDKLSAAQRAVDEAIEATKAAIPPQPETPVEEMESVPVQAEPLPPG